MLQHELVRVATTDREPSAKPRSVTLRHGEGSTDQEKQRSAQLVSAGPQAALLAPLVQGAEFRPWACVGLKSQLLLHGEGALGVGSQGPMAGDLSPWRRRGQTVQQPGGRGLARTRRAQQSGGGLVGTAARARLSPGSWAAQLPSGPAPKRPHRGRGSWVSFHEGQLSWMPGGWCPLPAHGAHRAQGHPVSAGAPEPL